MNSQGIATFMAGDRVIIRKAGPIFIREGKAYSANPLGNERYEIRYQIQTLRDCASCGVDPSEFGITRE